MSTRTATYFQCDDPDCRVRHTTIRTALKCSTADQATVQRVTPNDRGGDSIFTSYWYRGSDATPWQFDGGAL